MNMTSTHYYDRLGWSPLRIHTWPHSFTLAVSPAAQSGGREMPGGVWRPSRVGCGTSSHPGRGVWKSMSCDAPLTPRWLILQEHGKLCVCLGCAEDDEAEPDDNELPHKYKGCTAEATSCTARTG